MGQRRRFTPEFKRQSVQLLNGGQRPAAESARELGIPRNRLYKWQKDVAAHGGAFPGSGRQAEPAAELARLKRELARVTEERDILKKAAVGSSDQCNTLWGTVEWKGDRDGTYGASGLICGPESSLWQRWKQGQSLSEIG